MHPFVNIASRAAFEAGKIILRNIDKLDSIYIKSKGRNDFVSEVDFKAEQKIIEIIKTAYPDHSFLAEESGKIGDSYFQWVIDPLDGTTNYLHGFPVYCVSIALMIKGEISHAVVYDPLKEEMFHASIGSGAFLDQQRIRVKAHENLNQCLIGTGFPFKDLDCLDYYLETFKNIFPNSAGVRRIGSAALDLAYLASGRLDGFWEMRLKPWDMAAGVLLIKEAGGVVSDFNGEEEFLESGDIVCGYLDIHQKLLELIKNTN